MHAFPHRYHVKAAATPEGPVEVDSAGLPTLATTAPPEFDGPPGYWSPETMLAGAVANCYILSFRAVARASRLEWDDLSVEVEAVLDRVDGVTRFGEFKIDAQLSIRSAERETLARNVMDKAKRTCLVTNSLSGEVTLVPGIVVCEPAE